MIFSWLFIPLKVLVLLIIDLLPTLPNIEGSISTLVSFVQIGLWFTNAEIFISCIATFIAVETLVFGWNIIKFVYGKIPILNIH